MISCTRSGSWVGSPARSSLVRFFCDGGDVLRQRVGDRQQLGGGLAVPEAVLEAVQAGEPRVVDALDEAGRAARRPRGRGRRSCRRTRPPAPSPAGRPASRSSACAMSLLAEVGLDLGDLAGQVLELGGGVRLVQLVRRGQLGHRDRLDRDRGGAAGRRLGGDLNLLRGRGRLGAHQAHERVGAVAEVRAERRGGAGAERLDLAHDRPGGVVEVDLARHARVVGHGERLAAGLGRGELGRALGLAHGHRVGRAAGRGGQRGDRQAGREGGDEDGDAGRPPPPTAARPPGRSAAAAEAGDARPRTGGRRTQRRPGRGGRGAGGGLDGAARVRRTRG